MTEALVPARPMVPMDMAASMLADLCERIDNGETPEGALLACFDDTKLALADAVDRRIAFDHWIRGAIDAARSARDEWNLQLRKLEGLHGEFKVRTQAIIEANPDLPYQGKLGKIGLQKNPPSLETTFGSRELTPEVMELFGVHPDFVRTETKYYLVADAVKNVLKSGESLPWASLKQGQHIRFRK